MDEAPDLYLEHVFYSLNTEVVLYSLATVLLLLAVFGLFVSLNPKPVQTTYPNLSKKLIIILGVGCLFLSGPLGVYTEVQAYQLEQINHPMSK